MPARFVEVVPGVDVTELAAQAHEAVSHLHLARPSDRCVGLLLTSLALFAARALLIITRTHRLLRGSHKKYI